MGTKKEGDCYAGDETEEALSGCQNASSLREEITGLLRMEDRCTIYHIAPVLTGYFVSYLYPFPDDDNRFTIVHHGYRAVTLPVTGATGHRLGLG